MAIASLTLPDQEAVARADVAPVLNALSKLSQRAVPPWLRPGHPFPDGAPPKGEAAFAGVPAQDIVEIIAVRGPLHTIDGWSYLGRAISALLAGQPHAARHLAYYAELRAGLSILASAGIGVFNHRNVVVEANGTLHTLQSLGTHTMVWTALVEWAAQPHSLSQLIKPIQLAGSSLLTLFREFFPGEASTAAGRLMIEWGFDLQQGSADRDERNWSSYQPTAFSALSTTPAQDLAFLGMFWNALRPNAVELNRHLLRNLLETEARAHNAELTNYNHRHDRLEDGLKALLPLDFLTRVQEPVDHDFIISVAKASLPAHPYSMISRAGLLLKLATGVAESNLTAAGVQPINHFAAWWQEFGVLHGLWVPGQGPASPADLWEDISLALEDADVGALTHRNSWISARAGPVLRVSETERAALWGLLQ